MFQFSADPTITRCVGGGQAKPRHRGSAGQNVGVTQVGERIWLVTFMHYDLGYFDDKTCRVRKGVVWLSSYSE